MRWYLIVCTLLFVACQQPTAQDTEQEVNDEVPSYDMIIELERQLVTNASDGLDTELAGRIVEMSEEYATANSGDSLSAEILFKAGDVARGMRAYGKAIQLWGEVWRSYPESTQAPFSLFFQGFTFDNDLQDKERARHYYNLFLENFPEHELVKDVNELLATLDKTPEEILKEIQERNK
ncbi:MAG: hypothetical protein GYB31_04155 [Bacteroidetes bacterium]|nr:hypothetical protein [Bacteroidota bacterium]